MKTRRGTAPRSLGAALLLVVLAILPLARPARTSPSVNQEWAARYDGPANSYDLPGALVVDGGGNVYVTGASDGGVATGFDYATVKYNSTGARLWEARYNGPANSNDFPADLTVDGGGNVYVTGSSTGVGANSDYATVKYDSAGNQVWEARYDGLANGSDNVAALAVDGGGSVYVTGVSYGGVATDYDYATVKYDGAGNQVWVSRYDGPANSYDSANLLKVDGGGNVYVTGNSTGVGTQHDYGTVKYDSAGNQVWAARYNGPTNSYDSTVGLAVDGSGNVYVTGSSSSNYATVKYDSAGNQVWESRYNAPANMDDTAAELAIDGVGNIHVTGASYGSVATDTDYATVQYDSAGAELCVARYNGPASSSDNATALAVDGSGNVYVTGISSGPNGYDYATVKYGEASPTPPDTTPPVCVVGSVVVESPTRVYLPLTASDAGSGVAQAKLTANSTNCKLEWTSPSGVVTAPINTLLTISPAVAGATLRAVKLNASQRARVEVRVWDAVGNTTLVDPVIANLTVKNSAAPLVRVFRGIPQAERYVTLQNGAPGLRQATLSVNGRVVSQGSLADGQVVSLDVAQWLRPGSRNVVRISARGPKGATAVLTIGDVAPSSGAAVSAVNAAVNQEFAPQ